MPRRARDTKAILRTIERSERRSSLFWWMVDHHDEMAAAAARKRINWKAFCAEAARQGLRDTRGQIPTEGNARETWRQARKAVVAARAAEAARPPPRPGSVFPSRMPKHFKPDAFRTSVSATPVGGGATTPALASAPLNRAPPLPPVTHPADPAKPLRRPRYFKVSPGDPPEFLAALAEAEDQLAKIDRWMMGGPIKRRED